MRTFDRLAQAFGASPANGSGGAAARCGCQWSGCERAGEYRAPRSRSDLKHYWWFCLEHVRQYNAEWNYYAGMSDDEVEADIRRDVCWQRPTWPLGATIERFRAWRVSGIGSEFEEAHAPPAPPPMSTAEERALGVLDLQPPLTVAIVKARYKKLVKIYHPDANGGDKLAEERFKQINEAYRTVMSRLQP